ncbi:type VI secretion system Vgr family protein, partial [Neisseria dumasiana]|uniref:type VI secretion system Vgr family protein n=1 Tax=Neisseria dumasiana TaxID=1931275 RepID=UPI000A2511F8
LSFSRFSPSLSVVSFTATEALNTAYRLDIELTSADADLPLSSYINQAAKFTVTPVSSDALGLIKGMIAPQALKEWSGIITSCEKLSVSADETRYRMVLEPRIAALKHHRTSRLFQNQNVPDIISSLLKHHGFAGVDFRFNTSREYGVREYVTQYQESDFAFINRLCEEEGIWYAFEQNAQYGDVAVFGDDTAHYFRTNTSYPYRPHGGLESVGEEAVFALQVKHNPILESIRVGDYNYRDADTDLSSQVTAKDKESDSSVLLGSDSHWGLHHKTPAEAQLQTALLQQLDHSRRIVASGSGNITALNPGLVFQTAPSFSEAPNGWLVCSLHHSGSRDQAYSHHFTAIPADTIFRPERLTPLPKIQGSLPARVTSPGNYTYAYIDNMGRYRVKLPFDLDEWSPGGESRPIRLAKPYAGPDYGQHFPLHEGTEVMLSFVQGNPDRPYISGVMHDSSHPDHVPADWNTRNVIRTWANNKLRMEDKQGQEHIKLATEYGKTQLNLGHIVDS